MRPSDQIPMLVPNLLTTLKGYHTRQFTADLTAGMAALLDVVHCGRREGTQVVLADVPSQPVVALTNSAFYEELGEANLTGNIDDDANRALEYFGLPTAERSAFSVPTPTRESDHVERP